MAFLSEASSHSFLKELSVQSEWSSSPPRTHDYVTPQACLDDLFFTRPHGAKWKEKVQPSIALNFKYLCRGKGDWAIRADPYNEWGSRKLPSTALLDFNCLMKHTVSEPLYSNGTPFPASSGKKRVSSVGTSFVTFHSRTCGAFRWKKAAEQVKFDLDFLSQSQHLYHTQIPGIMLLINNGCDAALFHQCSAVPSHVILCSNGHSNKKIFGSIICYE